MEEAATISLSQASFRDFDEFSENVAGADMEITLPKLDESRWSISELIFSDSFGIQVGNEGSGSFAEGTTHATCFNLFFPKHSSMSTFNGISMDAGGVFLIQPGSEIHIIENIPNGWMNVLIPDFVASDLTKSPFLETVSTGVKMIGQGSSLRQNLWGLVTSYIATAAQTPSVLNERLSVDSFRESILHGISALFDYDSGTSQNTCGRRTAVDYRIISAALEFINERLDSVISVNDLSRHLGLSERTLRSGFKRYYGVSPSRYIQIRRLDRARKLLLCARKEETTVSEIACQLGMWDFGRFSVRYKRAFGESPSNTLGR